VNTKKLIVLLIIAGISIVLVLAGCATKSEAIVEEEPAPAESTEKEPVEKEEVVETAKAEEGVVMVEKEEIEMPQEDVMVRDSDGDGVPDDRDRCPDTPAGVVVDTSGCPEFTDETVSIQIILEFEWDSSNIRREYYEERHKLDNFMRQNPDAELVEVIVEGHTDSTGKKSYNYKLSRRRAEAVKQFLMSEIGLGPEFFKLRAYGEDRPIANNSTKVGRQKNRRVDIIFRVKNVKM
jgi:outer membrane protein OmpA-like peptidoglycan-associated protein